MCRCLLYMPRRRINKCRTMYMQRPQQTTTTTTTRTTTTTTGKTTKRLLLLLLLLLLAFLLHTFSSASSVYITKVQTYLLTQLVHSNVSLLTVLTYLLTCIRCLIIEDSVDSSKPQSTCLLSLQCIGYIAAR